LEKAIVKIGYLLALGFGEAGASIIGQNMTNGGDLDPMMPGARTYCIFGFCILDAFVECTEVLQGDIMTYVNRVAEITHSMVDRYGGSANKNIGEAFLLVWKFHDTNEIELMDEKGDFNNEELCLENKVIADVSVFSFLKIIAKLNSYDHILEYAEREDMKVIDPNFRCKMGFGIHQGWAIEGAIGSYFKVDASYLSPNVNMAARLEAATAQFGTLLLISGPLRDIMSPEMQGCCREIDKVTVKGSIKPMRLFTIDIQIKDLIRQPDPMGDKDIRVKKKLRDGMKAKMFASLYKGERTTFEEFSSDRDWIELRKYVSQEHEDAFASYYQAYLAGDWETAGEGFAGLYEQRPEDGPVASLHRLINEEAGRKAPADWAGYRPLTKK
jgi:class 3 adenylate cyclase